MLAQELKAKLVDARAIVTACGYTGDITSEGDSIKMRCPWHPDDGRPNLSIKMRSDGTLSVHCFSCQEGGDILKLIGKLTGKEQFADVMREARKIAGVQPAVSPVPSQRMEVYPPREEVEKFWGQARPVTSDPILCEQLRDRGIDPDMVGDLARAVPDIGWNPRWAWTKGDDRAIRWKEAGYSLLFPMYDSGAHLVSVHARRFQKDDRRKGVLPGRYKVGGLVMLSPAAIAQPIWHDAIIVEGAPNYLVLAALYPDRPVIGIIASSVRDFPRIPLGARVTIWTDIDRMRDDRPGAGQKYRDLILKALPRRRIRVVKLPIAEGARKAADANDVYKDGGAAAIAQVLDLAEPLSVDADPKAAAIWDNAAGLVDWNHPQVGVLESRDLVRLVKGQPTCRVYNEMGECIGLTPAETRGWMADELGLNFLRTGDAPPAGVIVTQGIGNFLALAAHWDDDDENAPAILAGPTIKAPGRLVLWPPQDCETDHEIILASLPEVAARTGRKAVEACLLSTQPQYAKTIIDAQERPQRSFQHTDLGNSERLAYYFGDQIRYVSDWSSFLFWDGRRWARDRTFEVDRRAAHVVRQLYEGTEADVKWAHESESAGKLAAMVNLVRKQPGIPILPQWLDSDPYLLNVRNGTIDLRTGELLACNRRHLITKLADVAYDPDAKCPVWEKFLRRIFDGKQALIDYVQRCVGYSLTGTVGEHVLFLLYGTGRNGKSTFLLTLQALMADYGHTTNSELLMFTGSRLDAGQQSAIASLKGARLVVASETEEGGKLSETVAKRLTKGDEIEAKFMGKDVFKFMPSHKLWVPTNHRPETKGGDEGLWSMLKPIPFDVTIPAEERDRTLPAKLAGESAGILNWALRGCIEWQARGLGQPKEIDDAVNAYRAEMDKLAPFIKDCCVVGSGRVRISHLRAVYDKWCEETSRTPINAQKFGKALEQNFPQVHDGSARYRAGLMIKAEWQDLLQRGERGE